MIDLESQAYRDGASEEDFMEEAGKGVALVVHEFIEKYDLGQHIILLCGKGNNAGDTYVAGTYLIKLGYELIALQISPISTCSPLCQHHHYRFLSEGGLVREIESSKEIAFPKEGVIIDGIFGTGFHGKVEDPFAAIIDLVNRSELPIISVDIPSGLNGETGEIENIAIKATETAFLGLPKKGFFLKEGWNHVGKLQYVDFGLGQIYIDEFESNLIMLSPELLTPHIPPVKRNRHKYERGYVVGLAGSSGMSGAAILSSWAALSGGAGIVRLLHPDGMQSELSATPYELIKTAYHDEDVDLIAQMMNRASANFIGPGIGSSHKTIQLLETLFRKLEKPCVIDADALDILANQEITLPKKVILTPHLGELKKLLKITDPLTLTDDFLKVCQAYVEDKGLTLILKGGPTFIFHPDSPIMVNPRGDPGMATAGSGDVLTGLIAALLAQGISLHHAAMLGVYIHSIAGEYAVQDKTSYCMTASDIVDRFPEAFWLLKPTYTKV